MSEGGITQMQTRFIRSAFIKPLQLPVVFGKDNQLVIHHVPPIIQETLATLQKAQLEKIAHDANYFGVKVKRVEHGFALIPSSQMIEFDPDGLVLQLTSIVTLETR
jgi:hypothetical protein